MYLFGKIQIRISESKNGSWIHKIHTQGGSSDQIQIQIFEIHNFGKGFLKCIFGKRFFWKRNGTEQMPNMYDTEPMLVTTY